MQLRYAEVVRHLLNLSASELSQWLIEHDQPAYRAAQIREWLFQRRAGSFEEMSNLPKTLREQLATEFCIWSAAVALHKQADDGTEKLLVDLADQHYPVAIDRARQKLGWNPQRRLRSTIDEMISRLKEDPQRWYQENNLPAPEED